MGVVFLVYLALVAAAVGAGLGWWLRGRAEFSGVIKSEMDVWQRAGKWGKKLSGERSGDGLPW